MMDDANFYKPVEETNSKFGWACRRKVKTWGKILEWRILKQGNSEKQDQREVHWGGGQTPQQILEQRDWEEVPVVAMTLQVTDPNSRQGFDPGPCWWALKSISDLHRVHTSQGLLPAKGRGKQPVPRDRSSSGSALAQGLPSDLAGHSLDWRAVKGTSSWPWLSSHCPLSLTGIVPNKILAYVILCQCPLIRGPRL